MMKNIFAKLFESDNAEPLVFDSLKPEYIDPIVCIEKLSFKDPWTLQSFQDELTNPLAYYVIGLLGGKVSAYGGFWQILNEGHITNIAVHPSFRRKGIGSRLLKEMIVRAKEKDIEHLTLEVRQSNQVAILLYEQFGFEFCGVRPHYYADGEDARIYWLELQ